MSEDTLLPFDFPAVQRRKVTAAFDGGRLTSDGGVLLLAAAERRIGIAERLARLIADPRNPLLVTQLRNARAASLESGAFEEQVLFVWVFGSPESGGFPRPGSAF